MFDRYSAALKQNMSLYLASVNLAVVIVIFSVFSKWLTRELYMNLTSDRVFRLSLSQ